MYFSHTDVTFAVKVVIPQFHASTDAYIGSRTVTDFTSATYEYAEAYLIAEYNNHEVDYSDYDAPYAFIAMQVKTFQPNGRILVRGYDLNSPLYRTVNSHYTGPVVPWTEEAPF